MRDYSLERFTRNAPLCGLIRRAVQLAMTLEIAGSTAAPLPSPHCAGLRSWLKGCFVMRSISAPLSSGSVKWLEGSVRFASMSVQNRVNGLLNLRYSDFPNARHMLTTVLIEAWIAMDLMRDP
jgi:hypothetical protein